MDKSEVRSLCEAYRLKGAVTVPEHESKRIIQGYGVSVPRGVLVETVHEAVRFAESVGFPVVVKGVSSEILHKTELQAVALDLRSASVVETACREIQSSFSERKVKTEGLLVEKMVLNGTELIAGLQNDPHFGPVIMLGTGGVLIHLLDDVTFRVLPVSRSDLEEMVEELNGKVLLRGFRGRPPLNEEALIRTLLDIARLGMDAAGLYDSMDFNPVLLTQDDAVVVDAKIVLSKTPSENGIQEEKPLIAHLDKFFEPEKVALIGASSATGKIGYVVADSLINHRYKGKVFPVTRGGKEIFGLKSYETLRDVPEKVDLLVVVVGLALVPDLLEQCRELEIPAMLIISGGGKELGGELASLEREIQQKARTYGIRVIGPNCIGCFNGYNRFDAFFQTHERLMRPKPGNISFITQSGTHGCSFLEACEVVGINKMISYGNRADVDEADMIAYLAPDPHTAVIAAYAEGLGDGRKFVQTARRLIKAHKKPIVIYKSGRTTRAAMAAQSHTGAYGGTYAVYRGAFKQSGILAVDSFEALFAASKALSMQPPAAGPKISMIGNGAGPMVNAIDLFDPYALEIAVLEPESVKAMEAHFPAFYISKNPVDVTGSATSDDYRFAMETLLEDPGVDVIMNWFVLQDTPLDEGIVDVLDRINKKSQKPILCGATGGPYTRKISRAIEEIGVPVFDTPHLWITAAKILVDWGAVRKTL